MRRREGKSVYVRWAFLASAVEMVADSQVVDVAEFAMATAEAVQAYAGGSVVLKRLAPTLFKSVCLYD